MEENIENADSQNGEENLNSENQENQDNLDAIKEKNKELSEKNRQLFERAKKAETSEKELRDKLKSFTETPKEAPKSESQPDTDYGKLAYLTAKGIDHPDDTKVVFDEAERLKLPLTDVLAMEHIKTKLQANKETREAKAGMPGGSNRPGGGSKGSVEYYLEKGGLPEDQTLAEKVVEARMKGDQSQNPFDPIRL